MKVVSVRSKMKKFFRRLVVIFSIILVLWALLTLVVERKGGKKRWDVGDVASSKRVLMIYDPDPFYNLDEQVCRSFAKALHEKKFSITIATVAAADSMASHSFQLYVLCANTYNWRPDWALTSFIRKKLDLKNKNVVAITLGAGSTASSKRAFEKLIKKKGGNLIESRTYWLWRPNDQKRTNESNVNVATSMVYEWAKKISAGFSDTSYERNVLVGQ